MKLIYKLSLMSAFLFTAESIKAQDAPKQEVISPIERFSSQDAPNRKIYSSTAFEGLMLSTSFIDNKVIDEQKMSPLRFTYFFNIGHHWNYDFNDHVGIYWGATIRNLGYRDKQDSIISVDRTYNIGIPVGLKLGNLSNGKYAFFGGGVDIPFHYKHKSWDEDNKNQKFKYSEWFSKDPNPIMPYVFVGAKFNSFFYAKLQYYPTNFYNSPNWVNVNILSLNFGFALNYRPRY